LGSDPIYQYGDSPGMHTLEPVYTDGGGGSPQWVDSFMDNLVSQPSLAFGYAQAGQENSFGWKAMKNGYTYQVSLLARLAKSRQIELQTLAQTGQWFRSRYRVTPPSAVVAFDDWKHENRKTIWYESRFYRLNLLWQNGQFFIRDFHCFDEDVLSPTHDKALTRISLAYQTLPVVDSAPGADPSAKSTGLWPELLSPNGATSTMTPIGPPAVKEPDPTQLSIEQSLGGIGTFSVTCSEANIKCVGLDTQGQPLPWAWDLIGLKRGTSSALRNVTSNTISYHYLEHEYKVRIQAGSCQALKDGSIRMRPDASGALVLDLNVVQ